MPDIDALNIIKVGIHSIGTEQTGDSINSCTNRLTAQREDMKQETKMAEKCHANTDSISNSNNKNRIMFNNQVSHTVEYFLLGPSYYSDKKKSAEITLQIQRDFKDVFNGFRCFDGTFLLQLKPDSKPYQAPQH